MSCIKYVIYKHSMSGRVVYKLELKARRCMSGTTWTRMLYIACEMYKGFNSCVLRIFSKRRDKGGFGGTVVRASSAESRGFSPGAPVSSHRES
jgi:uncharacterized membrane protein